MKELEKARIYGLLKGFLDESIEVEEFCAKMENLINFDLDFSLISDKDKGVIEEVFAAVTWFNPFENERNDYSGFRSSEDVKKMAMRAIEVLE